MTADATYAEGLGRAFVGASLFSLPLLMTMEMWQLGFSMDPARLVVLLAASAPLLIALSHFAGFERTFDVLDDALDAAAAFAVAMLAALAILALLGVLRPGQPIAEIVGKLALVAIPGAIGALLADKQLGTAHPEEVEEERSYGARLFLMGVGALFVALNVAPTEEMMVIAFQISPWQSMALAVGSLLLIHALQFKIAFRGRDRRRGDREGWAMFARYSCAGYLICLTSSAFLLWAFGRTDGMALAEATQCVVVLTFPAALGAGVAQILIGEQRG